MANRKVSIKLLGEAKEEYLRLQETVRQEKEKGIESSSHQTLLRSLNSKIAILKSKYDYGTQVPRNIIPEKYLEQYSVTNLWKVDLSDYWRMIYTLRQPQRGETEIDVLLIWLDVPDIISHPKYDKIFGYRKK